MVRFGEYSAEVTFEKLAVGAAREAMADAGVSTPDIESVYVGNVFGGPRRRSTRRRADGSVWSAGITRIRENYCASGATAIREAWIAITAGLYDIVLVIGAEKMTDRVAGGVMPDPTDLDAINGLVMAANHGMSARRYMFDHGAARDQIAAVAVKNHAHSVHDPYAQYQRTISLQEVLQARTIADPLGLLDCSPIAMAPPPSCCAARPVWPSSGRSSRSPHRRVCTGQRQARHRRRQHQRRGRVAPRRPTGVGHHRIRTRRHRPDRNARLLHDRRDRAHLEGLGVVPVRAEAAVAKTNAALGGKLYGPARAGC